MRILVFGGDGMLGRELVASWGKNHKVHATWRTAYARATDPRSSPPDDCVCHVCDVRDLERARRVFDDVRPDAVVNAVGIIKQREEAHDPISCIEVNSLWPHILARMCERATVRLVHVSTDCVFSGEAGHYAEIDPPDPIDLYGRSKLLGEVYGALTLRTSLIGLKDGCTDGLIEWFLSQRGQRQIQGFRRAVFSGLTTREFARVVERVLIERGEMIGAYHVAAASITKLDLLVKLRDRLGIELAILPVDGIDCDRSLDAARFNNELSYSPPSWDQMIDELAAQIEERDRGVS